MPEQLPVWRNVGVEPPESLKTSGWEPGMKPSAQHMNWLLNRIYIVLEELQNNGDLSLIEQKVNELENEVTTHLAKSKVGAHNAINITVEDTANVFTATDVEGVLNELFTFADEGKTSIANAVTSKGVSASPSDTFPTLANKIEQIETKSVLTGDAMPNNVLAGKTFYSNNPDNKLTGTIPSKTAATITPSTTNQTIPGGQYLSGVQTILGDTNLIPANIVQGRNIFNVAGAATIASLGGKKWAGGQTSITNQLSDFYNGDGSLLRLFSVQVTGLTFKPSKILLYTVGSNFIDRIVYDNRYPVDSRIMYYRNSSEFRVIREAGAVSVTNTGFVLPHPISPLDGIVYWEAYE